MMDTLQLKTFMAIVQAGSFSRAAERLCCVQSNVTARIKRLERQLGAPLFERGRNGAALTTSGLRLKFHAEDILARLAAAETDMLDAVGGAAPLRLGAMESTAATRLPPLMKRLHKAFPEAALSLETGATDDLLNRVFDRELDAAFVAAPVDAERFASAAAFREELVLAAPPEAGITAPLISFRAGCAYRARAEQWLRASGHAPLKVVEMGSLDGILGCVAAGMGIAVVPQRAAESSQHRDGLRLEALPAAFRASETRLAWRHDLRQTRALRQLLVWLAAE